MNKFTNALKAEKTSDDYDASFIASTPMADRGATTVPQENWKLDNFNKNPIIGYMHNVWGSFFGEDHPDSVIGKGHAFINGDGNLQLDVKFDDSTSDSGSRNEVALKVKAKVESGFLSAVSVGFTEDTEGKYVDSDGKNVKNPDEDSLYQYGELELMEVSCVNLPMNAEALVMSKNAEIQSLKKEIEGRSLLKKEVKDVSETFKTVAETLQIFGDTMKTTGDWEVDTLTIIEEDDIEDLENDKIEELYKLRKRKAIKRQREMNL